MGESWDHQVDEVAIVKVEREWLDYALVESAFYDRKREVGRVSRVSRDTHRIVQVRRIQNRRQLGMFKTERQSMECKRGTGRVELTTRYAWHGSGKVRPDSIAAGDGFMMQVRAGPGGCAGQSVEREGACVRVGSWPGGVGVLLLRMHGCACVREGCGADEGREGSSTATARGSTCRAATRRSR